jgi:hypothetical protein
MARPCAVALDVVGARLAQAFGGQPVCRGRCCGWRFICQPSGEIDSHCGSSNVLCDGFGEWTMSVRMKARCRSSNMPGIGQQASDWHPGGRRRLWHGSPAPPSQWGRDLEHSSRPIYCADGQPPPSRPQTRTAIAGRASDRIRRWKSRGEQAALRRTAPLCHGGCRHLPAPLPA